MGTGIGKQYLLTKNEKENGKEYRHKSVQEIKTSSLEQNAKSLSQEYKLDERGFFGEKKGHCQVIFTDTPEITGMDFYQKLGRGGKTVPMPRNSNGTITLLDDGSRITFRIVTSTSGSPAVEVHVAMTKSVAIQKIHFIKK